MKKNSIFICLLTCLMILDDVCSGNGVLDDVLTAVEKGIGFYANNYASMNIDGIFGLRVLEGQLKLVANFMKASPELPDDLKQQYTRVVDSHKQAKDISDSSIDSLKKSDERYYKLMNPVIQRPWSFGRNYQRLDPNLKWKKEFSPDEEIHMVESQSDKCMSELLGTQTGIPCSIGKECILIMSARGMIGYGITHQLLYTMLAEQSGCIDVLNSKLLLFSNHSLSVEQLQAEFCVNNFYETSSSVLIQKGIINARLHDLFLEQELICAMLGYVEFLHIEWLRQIISWQLPSGCFGDPEGENPDQLMGRRGRKNMPSNKPAESAKDIKFNIIDNRRPTPIDQRFPLPLDRRIPLGKQKQMGNLGSLDQITPSVQKEPMVAVQTLLGRHSNLRKNVSRVPRALPSMRYSQLKMERGKLGEHEIKPIKSNRKRYEGMIKGSGKNSNYVNRDQGKVGDTRVRIKEIMEKGVGEEGGARDKLGPDPVEDQNAMADEEDSFNINRQINRKLLYEKALKDGCLAHKTAVAMGALTQYLRFIVLANSSKFDALKHLYGTNYLMHPDSLLHPSDDSVRSLLSPANSLLLWKPTELPVPDNSLRAKASLFGSRKKYTPILGNRASTSLDANNSADRLSKDTRSSVAPDVEVYEDDADADIPAVTLPIVKSDEDELLLYDELSNLQGGAKSASKAVRQTSVGASHLQVMADSSFEGGVTSVGSTYGVVIAVTSVILLLLYRSLRKHRSVVQHRQSRWR